MHKLLNTMLNKFLLYHPTGELNPLHGFVKKSGREILQNRSRQGLRPFSSSDSLSFTPRFSTQPCSTDVSRLNQPMDFQSIVVEFYHEEHEGHEDFKYKTIFIYFVYATKCLVRHFSLFLSFIFFKPFMVISLGVLPTIRQCAV